MSHEKIKPKIITVFKQGYSTPVFFKDLTAGIIVGIVLHKKLPEKQVKWFAAVTFILFGMWGLYEAIFRTV